MARPDRPFALCGLLLVLDLAATGTVTAAAAGRRLPRGSSCSPGVGSAAAVAALFGETPGGAACPEAAKPGLCMLQASASATAGLSSSGAWSDSGLLDPKEDVAAASDDTGAGGAGADPGADELRGLREARLRLLGEEAPPADGRASEALSSRFSELVSQRGRLASIDIAAEGAAGAGARLGPLLLAPRGGASALGSPGGGQGASGRGGSASGSGDRLGREREQPATGGEQEAPPYRLAAAMRPPAAMPGSQSSASAEATSGEEAGVAQEARRMWDATGMAEDIWSQVQAVSEDAAKQAAAKVRAAREARAALLAAVDAAPAPSAAPAAAPGAGPGAETGAASAGQAPGAALAAAPDGGHGGEAFEAAGPGSTSVTAAAEGPATARAGSRTPARVDSRPRCGGPDLVPCSTFFQVMTFGYTTQAWRGCVDWIGLGLLGIGYCSMRCGSRLYGCFLVTCGVLLVGLGLLHGAPSGHAMAR